jgi:hypothetical protein
MLYLDAAETFWRDWVLSYDIGRQGTLVDRVERSGRHWSMGWLHQLRPAAERWKEQAADLAFNFGPPLLATVSLSFILWFAGPRAWRLLRVRHGARRLRQGRGSVADAAVMYERMLELLARRGYHKPSWFTANEFASTLPSGELRQSVAEFSKAYYAVRFGGRSDAAPELTRLLDHLQPEN